MIDGATLQLLLLPLLTGLCIAADAQQPARWAR